jgi:hypothetical protein
MDDIVTSNLEDFGIFDRAELIRLLTAWNDQGLPEDFNNDGVHACLNTDSGYVFLTNSDYQVAMMNDDKLETWYSCFNCGHEGFKEDCQLTEDGCNDCLGENNV